MQKIKRQDIDVAKTVVRQLLRQRRTDKSGFVRDGPHYFSDKTYLALEKDLRIEHVRFRKKQRAVWLEYPVKFFQGLLHIQVMQDGAADNRVKTVILVRGRVGVYRFKSDIGVLNILFCHCEEIGRYIDGRDEGL